MFDTASDAPFAPLLAPGVEHLRVAWHHLRVPGPPPEYGLQGEELEHPDPRRRFARRAIQLLACGPTGDPGCETLALIDKASPHSLYDLMLSEVSSPPKSTAGDVSPRTGRTLWRTGLNFVRFCAQRAVGERFGLSGGELHLALNCDPHTWDRESVQAAKQFHLHLLYWGAEALEPLGQAQPLGEIADRRLRRQALDPLTFLGARLVTEGLQGLPPGVPGATLLAPDEGAALAGSRPLGAVLSLPGWHVLDSEDFEDLVRRIHRRLEALATLVLEALTGRVDPPRPWHRHPLLPMREIGPRIADLPFGTEVKEGLRVLAGDLRALAPGTARWLAQATPRRRMDLMTLNQPCYALNLHAAGSQSDPLADEVHLIIQPKLFSGIGGAGLLTLGGIQSVRILRGQGSFSNAQWEHRADFQREFTCFNQGQLLGAEGAAGAIRPSRVRRFGGPSRGWVT